MSFFGRRMLVGQWTRPKCIGLKLNVQKGPVCYENLILYCLFAAGRDQRFVVAIQIPRPDETNHAYNREKYHGSWT